MLKNAFAYVLHHNREPVTADVWMGIDKDGSVCSETDELVEHLTDVSTLRRAGV